MSQLYHEFGVTLQRRSVEEAWGIRLAGGSDLNSPLIVVRVRIVFRFPKTTLLWDNKLPQVIIEIDDDKNKTNPIHDVLSDAISIFIVGSHRGEGKHFRVSDRKSFWPRKNFPNNKRFTREIAVLPCINFRSNYTFLMSQFHHSKDISRRVSSVEVARFSDFLLVLHPLPTSWEKEKSSPVATCEKSNFISWRPPVTRSTAKMNDRDTTGAANNSNNCPVTVAVNILIVPTCSRLTTQGEEKNLLREKLFTSATLKPFAVETFLLKYLLLFKDDDKI